MTFQNASFGMFTYFKYIMKELSKTFYLKIFIINCGRKLFHHYDIIIAKSQYMVSYIEFNIIILVKKHCLENHS